MIIVFQSQSIGEALDTTHTLTHARVITQLASSSGVFVGMLTFTLEETLRQSQWDCLSETRELSL